MTDLDDFIKTIVNDRGPIKGVDLALECVTHIHDLGDREVQESFDRLVRAEEIIEIEYVLPSIDYRVKSMFFPKGTKISRSL